MNRLPMKVYRNICPSPKKLRNLLMKVTQKVTTTECRKQERRQVESLVVNKPWIPRQSQHQYLYVHLDTHFHLGL